jgi:hypothetical protein
MIHGGFPKFDVDEVLQGNTWTCPAEPIRVVKSIDEMWLGGLVCRGDGPSEATSKHAVVDMLIVDPAADPRPQAGVSHPVA